jgi:hypothetical protein
MLELSTAMPGRRLVAESAVVHVLFIDTFTHSGFFPAGQRAGLCENAHSFLCSTTLSGGNRNLPAGRKPERVNEAFKSTCETYLLDHGCAAFALLLTG